MKKILAPVIAVMFVMLVFGFSSAQAPGGPPPADKEITPEKFGELKADLLKRIDDRMQRIAEEKTCVSAATNMEELRKCRPQRPAGPGGPGGQGKTFPPFGQPR